MRSDKLTRALFILTLDFSRSFLDEEKPRDLSIVYEARCREQLSKDGANNKTTNQGHKLVLFVLYHHAYYIITHTEVNGFEGVT